MKNNTNPLTMNTAYAKRRADLAKHNLLASDDPIGDLLRFSEQSGVSFLIHSPEDKEHTVFRAAMFLMTVFGVSYRDSSEQMLVFDYDCESLLYKDAMELLGAIYHVPTKEFCVSKRFHWSFP